MMEGMEWRWLNEPAEWHQTDDGLQVVTDRQTDFWRSTLRCPDKIGQSRIKQPEQFSNTSC